MADLELGSDEQKPSGVPATPTGQPSDIQLRLYGEDFPGINGDGPGWKKWMSGQIRQQESSMSIKRLHWSRHRHFWAGEHWISTRDGRTWRTADDDQNSLRQTVNIVGPALDFRLGIVQEQQPGFKCYPLGTGIEGKETADAQQRVAEYYYHKLKGNKLLRDVEANAFTDGAAFLQVYVDKSGGPKREDVRLIPPSDERFEGLKAQGYEEDAQGFVVLPVTEEGNVAPIGTKTRTFNEGDIGSRVVMAHEVWFDPESKTVNGPYDRAKWAVIRRVRDLKSARRETGKPELEPDSSTSSMGDPILDSSSDFPSGMGVGGYKRGLAPFPTSRLRDRQAGVFDFLVYLSPNEAAGIPRGLWRRIVGDVIVSKGDVLPGGKIPLARFTDGSSDTELYPRPQMSSWVPDQITINAIITKNLETLRNAPGRLLAQRGTIVKETYTTGIGAVLEYIGAKPDVMQALRQSPDAWTTLELIIKKLEDKTAWNDLARGKVSGGGGFQDVSGRALLGARELYERTFGPMIRAAAEGMSDWSVLLVDYARYLYQTPRLIPMAGRGDLAKKIAAEDLGEESLTYCDAETMSPLPKALRSQMLFDLYDKRLISASVLKKRSPYAEIKDVEFGESQQWDRAQYINTVIEQKWEEFFAGGERYNPQSGGLAVLWADDPQTHQTALEELMFDERKPFGLRAVATERWGIYDQLGRAKGGTDPATGAPIPPSASPPLEVMGIPPDIIQQMMMMMTQMQQPAQGGQAPGTIGAPAPNGSAGVPGQAAMPVSATPSTSSVMPQASAPYMPLGALGPEEAASVQDKQQA